KWLEQGRSEYIINQSIICGRGKRETRRAAEGRRVLAQPQERSRRFPMTIDWASLFGSVGLALLGGLGMYFGIGGIFELAYYRRRNAAAEWKCQPRRWPSPKARRDEIILGAANLSAASSASGIFVYYVKHGGYTTLYYSFETHGILFTL